MGNQTAVYGTSWNREVAAAKALAEALRLYSAAFYDPSELRLCAQDSAPFNCVLPSEFALFLPDQYNDPDFTYVPFTSDTRVRWLPGCNLTTDEETYIPAVMGVFPYRAAHKVGEGTITPSTPSGLACAHGRSAAILAAVCEVLQNDALALTWQGRFSPPQIRVETLDDLNYGLVVRFEKLLGDVVLLDLRLDVGLPVVLACLKGRSAHAPALVVGAGTDPDPKRAVTLSLEELAMIVRFSQQIMTHIPQAFEGSQQAQVKDQVQHLGFWCNHANRGFADFLFSSNDRVELDEMSCWDGTETEEVLRALIERLAGMGYQVIMSDLTTPDLRSLGLNVIRTVVPGFHPLFVGHGNRALGGSRLCRFLSAWNGARPAGDQIEAAVPHPFLIKGINS